MIRIRFVRDGTEVYVLDKRHIYEYSLGGKKMIADDFFMNEPASVDVSIIFDYWLNDNWESEGIRIGHTVWFKIPVEIDLMSPISGMYEQKMVGLIDLTQCESDPFKHRMKLVIYDYSALLSQLDESVRFYYPYTPEGGTDWSRFYINYALPGEEASLPDEDHVEGTQFFPYENTIELHTRQVSDILAALSSIWQKSFEGLWELGFRHEYNEGGSEPEEVQNMIVELGREESFYAMVQAMLRAIGLHKSMHSVAAITNTWVNYGLIPPSARSEIYAEYGLLFRVECDAFFVIRAGYEADFGDRYEEHEWYRILALKGGREVFDSGQRARHYESAGNIDSRLVGVLSLEPLTEIESDEGGRYRSSINDLDMPSGYEDDPEGYFVYLAYFVYFSGILGGGVAGGRTGYVRFGSAEHFFAVFIAELVEPVYQRYQNLPTQERVFWANYGLVPAAMRNQFMAEYGIMPDDECDGWLLLRAGYTYRPSSRDSWDNPEVEIDDGTQTDGEGGGQGGYSTTSHEQYRLFAVRDGEIVRDYGVKNFGRHGVRNGKSLGNYALNPGNMINLGENLFYDLTNNNMGEPGTMTPEDLAQYEYRLGYSLMGYEGWLANRIFRMRPTADAGGHEQYLEQRLRDWFKLMFFIGDISCFADETGIITFAPREAKGEIDMVWDSLVSAKKQLLIYQPWDREKLGEYIDDKAEIDYLIEYYGGHRVLSHALEFEFVTRGWESFPGLRDRFALSGANGVNLELLGSGWYMVVEVRFDGVKRVFVRAVKV